MLTSGGGARLRATDGTGTGVIDRRFLEGSAAAETIEEDASAPPPIFLRLARFAFVDDLYFKWRRSRKDCPHYIINNQYRKSSMSEKKVCSSICRSIFQDV